MPPAARQQALIEDLSFIENAQERLTCLVDRARRQPALPVSEKNELNRVAGCVSAVWISATLVEGQLLLRYDAESPLVKGLVGLVCEIYHAATPAEILATPLLALEELGIARDLSPTRRNGLAAVHERLRQLATRHS